MPSKNIISQSDSRVKSFQNANDPRGAYHKDIIYLFEKANASTFMHETARWFKEELKKFGSEKSAMMLKKVDEWENRELSRRYTVDFKGGYYVVKNKRGSVVYDQNFQTAEDAKDYAKEEIFAQRFEAYLKHQLEIKKRGKDASFFYYYLVLLFFFFKSKVFESHIAINR